jgi:ribosome-associated protein
LIDTNGTRITSVRGELVGIRREAALQRSLENACLIAQDCENHRGKQTVVLDVTQATALFDFFVITTGNNRRQLRAIAESADEIMAQRHSDLLGREGNDAPWICHDYGDVVLHVFSPDGRSQYDLGHLWGDAVPVDWQATLETMNASVAG